MTKLPQCAAECKAVTPWVCLALTFAPFSNKILQISKSFRATAECKGVTLEAF